ncbi:hypothetical protein [Aneurinibacillus terranovensis]|uniref:hypothetical protein n=1 Tax=Aneurinibacillus terranovensis TaxID=278991 RepID=UPI000556C840|nr:hypothetical protein [Aneurinibacillus terranovensis]
MAWVVWCILLINLLMGISCYKFLKRYRRVIDCHTGMNVAMTASGTLGLVTGMILMYQFPVHYSMITIFTTLIAIVIGILFGALGDLQSIIAGASGGIMVGIMSPMIEAMADQPFILIIFITVLSLISFGFLCFSIKLLDKTS